MASRLFCVLSSASALLPTRAPRCAQPAVEDDLTLDDDIAEEVYSLEADSYHSDGEFDQLEADSDKSGGGDAAWVRARASHLELHTDRLLDLHLVPEVAKPSAWPDTVSASPRCSARTAPASPVEQEPFLTELL